MTHVCPTQDRSSPRVDEQAARHVLNPFLNASLYVWDDNSEDRMWDFCLVDSDGGHQATLEVTRNTSQSLKALNEQLLQTGLRWDAPAGLARRWAVQFEHTAQPKRVRSDLAELLMHAEDTGHSQIGSRYGMPMHKEAKKLGVWSAIAIGDANGTIYVTAGPSGWWGDRGHVTKGMLEEAERNELKLRAAPPPRHLAVWVDAVAIAATIEMTEQGPPHDVVSLPPYVDVAWALCGEAYLDGAAVWRIEDGQPWTILKEFSFR